MSFLRISHGDRCINLFDYKAHVYGASVRRTLRPIPESIRNYYQGLKKNDKICNMCRKRAYNEMKNISSGIIVNILFQ